MPDGAAISLEAVFYCRKLLLACKIIIVRLLRAKPLKKGGMELKYTEKEVLQFIEENDVKFVRLMFFDIFGTTKNISIMADELPAAFKNGVTFNASAVSGFEGFDADLVLVPEPATLAVLPWRPQHGRVVRLFCTITYPNGVPFDADVRSVLKKAMKRAASASLTCNIDLECEFYLFKTDDGGNPTKIPYDNAGYLDIAPLDKGENVRRQICFTLEQMEMTPLSSHHERGPGQNEIDFMYSDPITAADNFSMFKAMVKTIANSNGLFASFMPKPIDDKSGNSMHINVMVEKYGYNIFKKKDGELSTTAKYFIAGILKRISEITAFLNPIENSYKRFNTDLKGGGIGWAYGSYMDIIRIISSERNNAKLQIISPDPACNPYLAFALIINAGLDGVEAREELCAPSVGSSKLSLPSSLEAALSLAEKSEFIKSIIPERLFKDYISYKQKEVELSKSSDEIKSATDSKYFEIL